MVYLNWTESIEEIFSAQDGVRSRWKGISISISSAAQSGNGKERPLSPSIHAEIPVSRASWPFHRVNDTRVEALVRENSVPGDWKMVRLEIFEAFFSFWGKNIHVEEMERRGWECLSTVFWPRSRTMMRTGEGFERKLDGKVKPVGYFMDILDNDWEHRGYSHVTVF